jgi:hypothetical protein
VIVPVVATKFVIVAELERMVPENPFSELTGPVKVVDAIETPHARVAH